MFDITKSKLRTESWPEANEFFKKDPYWRGSDDGYTVPLGNNRILWLFGDTLISNKSEIVPRHPDHVKMINNSIGIQSGSNNPVDSNVKIDYYWGNNNSNTDPDSFFINPNINKEHYLWPGDAVLLPDGKTLVFFFMEIIDENDMFKVVGWQNAIVRNSHDAPEIWNVEWVKCGGYEKLRIITGCAESIIEDDYLFAFGTDYEDKIRSVYIARWPLGLFDEKNPDLSNPEWWNGENEGWTEQNKIKKMPYPVLENGQTEFTVTKMNNKYVLFQYTFNTPGRETKMGYRIADRITGPFSDTKPFGNSLYNVDCCPEDLAVYAGKYHPELTSRDEQCMILTYATNTMSLETLWKYDKIYYLEFIKLFCNK